MEFEKLVKKCGFGLAVVLHWPKLSKDKEFINKLNFDQWIQIYNVSFSDSKLNFLALEKIREVAKNFDEWLEVYNQAPSDSDLKELAFQKMREVAKNFDEWLEVYNQAPSDSQLQHLAFQKMSEIVN